MRLPPGDKRPGDKGGRGPMRRHQWLASGCVIALAAGLTACGGSSGGSGGGGGGASAPAAPSSPVGGTPLVLQTLHPARVVEPTRPVIDHVPFDTPLTYKGPHRT